MRLSAVATFKSGTSCLGCPVLFNRPTGELTGAVQLLGTGRGRRGCLDDRQQKPASSRWRAVSVKYPSMPAVPQAEPSPCRKRE